MNTKGTHAIRIFLSTILLLTSPWLHAAIVSEQILPSSGGDSVAISGEWGFVGDVADCQVYVYRYDYLANKWGDGGDPSAEGVPYTILRQTGACSTAEYGGFGASVSTSNNLLVVGAPLAKDQGTGNIRYGRIFFYQYDPNVVNDTKGWVLRQSVGEPIDRDDVTGEPVPDRQALSGYGDVVSVRYEADIGKALLVAGAPFYDLPTGGVDHGKAYLYEWTEFDDSIRFVNSVDGEAPGDNFGSAVTSNASRFLVGARLHDSGNFTNNGKAYLYDYDVSDNTIAEAQTIQNLSADGDNYHLGSSVSLGPDGVMLLGGTDSFILEDPDPVIASYTETQRIPNTLEADVSQNDNVAGVAVLGTSVDLYYDHFNIVPPADLTISKSEANYGRDISVATDGRLMVNGNTLNQAYAYYTPCGGTNELIANRWTMIGLQCDVNGATIVDIFGDDLGVYDDDYVLYKQNGTNYKGASDGYVRMEPNETLIQGVGYWIIAYQNSTWAIDAPVVATATDTNIDPFIPEREDVAAVFVIDLAASLASKAIPDYNIKVMYSNPFQAAMEWQETAIRGASGALRVNVLNDLFEENNCDAYVYDSATASFATISACTPGFPTKIEPGAGFFVRYSADFQTILDSTPAIFDLLLAQPK